MADAAGVIASDSRKRKKQPQTSPGTPQRKSPRINTGVSIRSHNISNRDQLPSTSKLKSIGQQTKKSDQASASNKNPAAAIPVPLQNSFGILQDNEHEVIVQCNNVDNKKPRIPPIVIQSDKIEVINLLRRSNIQTYSIKLTSIGVQLHC